MGEKIVAVCSKPTQVIQVAGFLRQYPIANCVLVILTQNFSGAEDFKKAAEAYLADRFSDVFFVASRENLRKLMSSLEFDRLFVECDRAQSYLFYRQFSRNGLTVFEEGIGTYCGGPDDSLLGLRKTKWRLFKMLFGSGMFFGNGRATREIIVNDSALYLALNDVPPNKVLQKRTFLSEVVELRRYLDLGVLTRYAGKRIALVLGTKGSNLGETDWRDRAPEADVILLKSHPHDVSRAGERPPYVDDLVLPGWVPAELLVLELSRLCAELTVFHYSCSAALYCRNLPNVLFKNLGYNRRYEIVMRAALDAGSEFGAREACRNLSHVQPEGL